MTSADLERLRLPIADLVTQYLDALRTEKRDDDHLRITKWMTEKLVELCDWRYFSDVTVESLHQALKVLDGQKKTASYQNKFIIRAKAFVHWLLPPGQPSPLAKLKRVNEKDAPRTRARRAATAAEFRTIFDSQLPADRRLAYALAAMNGLRRNEAASLAWDQLHLNATIPFVKLRRKRADDPEPDYIPLHPYVLALLRERTPGMPTTKVLPSVPDMKTVKRDWERAGVRFTDDRKRRLDYHGLRHTFETLLDHTGCSRATAKKLTRHADEDVTDGYAHAELAEMLTALQRLPSPLSWGSQPALKTGTDDTPVQDHRQDHAAVISQHSAALPCATPDVLGTIAAAGQVDGKSFVAETHSTPGHGDALRDLNAAENAATVLKTGPSTQVD